MELIIFHTSKKVVSPSAWTTVQKCGIYYSKRVVDYTFANKILVFKKLVKGNNKVKNVKWEVRNKCPIYLYCGRNM